MEESRIVPKVGLIVGVTMMAMGVVMCRSRKAEVVPVSVTTSTSQPLPSITPKPEPEPEPEIVQPLEVESVEPWIETDKYEQLVGKWQDAQKRPIPFVEIVQRDDSRTPFNIKFHIGVRQGGCGFDGTDWAWCVVYDEKHKSVPYRSREELRMYTRDDSKQLRVVATSEERQLFDVELVRMP